MAEYNHFYQRALYYDIVFKRDVNCEIDFIAALYQQRHGKTPRSLLDLACGPGYHARTFAGRGCRAVGLDLREEMIAFAEERAAEDGVQVEWVAQDMRNFRLDQPVDVAISMFDGIDCLTTNADLVAHFQALAANLTPGGLYFIDVTHPRDITFKDYNHFEYGGVRDGIRVQIVWATNNPQVDPITSISHTELRMYIDDHGEQIEITDHADERLLNAQEITLLAALSGVFEVVGWYGGYNVHQPLDNSPQSTRMIGVLQKTGEMP